MAESTLSLTRTDLLRAVGTYLGWGDPANVTWTSLQTQKASDAIDSGVRKFYNPPVLPGEHTNHNWSFLEPLLSLSLVANTNDYPLPDDFGGFIDTQLSFNAGDNAWHPLKITSDVRILQLRERDSSSLAVTTQPEFAAVRPTAQGTPPGETGQRFTLMVWPNVTASYTLNGPYRSNPYQLTGTSLYPLGGQPHAETLQEACLAAAERNINDEIGNHAAEFMVLLKASVDYDRRFAGPKHFGYNADRSRNQVNDRRYLQLVTYDGNAYPGVGG